MSFLSVSRKSLRRLVDDKRGGGEVSRVDRGGDYATILNSFRCGIFVCRENNGLFFPFFPFAPPPPSPLPSLLLFHGTFCWRRPRGRASPNSSTSFGSTPYFLSPRLFRRGARETSYVFYIPHRCLEAVFSPLQN